MRTLRELIVDSLPIQRVLILTLICLLAFWVRLFAVIRFESVIHEFDPYFNFRTTKFLAKEGFGEWWNWFDAASWYPLGRVVGQTLFPGLMSTAYAIYQLLGALGLTIDIKDVCVFTAPIFSGLTACAAYLLTIEGTGRYDGALFAALFLSLAPSYMSRSVAGSYDNEAVAIFAMVSTFYAYVRALNRTSAASAALAALAYFYMVSSWGGYVFITNTIAIHTMALFLLRKLTVKHYAVYSVFHILGTLFCLNIPFVNFAAVRSSEHLSSHGVFLFLQAALLYQAVRYHLPSRNIQRRLKLCMAGSLCLLAATFIWLSTTGRTRWAGRSMTLLDPTYAGKHIPIIASVAEHQPPTWASFIFDLHVCAFLAPAGLWLVFARGVDAPLFLGLYGILAVYFSCVMVRLMLVLCPAACILAGVGLSYVLNAFIPSGDEVASIISGDVHSGDQTPPLSSTPLDSAPKNPSATTKKRSPLNWSSQKIVLGLMAVVCLFGLGFRYVKHGVFASAFAYSHPSIILSMHTNTGQRIIQDDFREAYYWLRKNSHKDARIMSWWDYGYQSAAMGERTVIVDNNTWNNTHIATVGLAFASPEKEAFAIVSKLDVDYVFVIFGGIARFNGDDINKFLWMIRIANGVFPWIKEADYFNKQGEYAVGKGASDAMRKSLMHSLSYYRFDEGPTKGTDLVRRESVEKIAPLKHFEEAYTTENWLVRIYKVEWLRARYPATAPQLQVKQPTPMRVSSDSLGIETPTLT